jgi:hypothetical protein
MTEGKSKLHQSQMFQRRVSANPWNRNILTTISPRNWLLNLRLQRKRSEWIVSASIVYWPWARLTYIFVCPLNQDIKRIFGYNIPFHFRSEGYRLTLLKDHAAGDLIVREAGGCVTDVDGKRLDFTQGKKLINNRGIAASNGKSDIHERILTAVREVFAEKDSSSL